MGVRRAGHTMTRAMVIAVRGRVAIDFGFHRHIFEFTWISYLAVAKR